MMINIGNFKISLVFALLYFFAISCNDAQEHHTQDGIDDSHHSNHSSVVLDNNEKWKANEETNRGIANMMIIVKNENASGGNPDCAQVQNKLHAEFEQILQKCTMKGEAHNQLHNYLMPLSTHIENLNVDDEADCKANLNTIEEYLAEYSHYFE